MPGSEEEAAEMLDSYLITQRQRAEDQARAAVPAGHWRDNDAPIQRDEAGRGGTEIRLN
jgi:hypothetical protein